MDAPITIEGWIYPTDDENIHQWACHFGGGSGNATGLRVSFGMYGNYYCYISDNRHDGGSPEKNNWQHVAMTYDKSTLTLYKNATLKNSWSETASIDDGVFTIGAKCTSASDENYDDYLEGYIFDVRLWNAVVSEEDIDEYKNKCDLSSHPNIDDLKGRWLMLEGEGDTVYDDEAGQDGTIYDGDTASSDLWVIRDEPDPVSDEDWSDCLGTP